MKPTRAQILQIIRFKREMLQKGAELWQGRGGEEPQMLRELDEIEKAVDEPDAVLTEKWEQHELHWMAYMAEIQRRVAHGVSQVMLAMEDKACQDPAFLEKDPKMQEMLRQWREDGLGEEFLGQLPIAERRAIEEEARKRREGNS